MFLSVLLLISVLSLASIFTYAVALNVNGEWLGYTDNMGEAKEMVANTLEKQAEGLGVSAQTSDQIEYNRVLIRKEELLNNKVSESRLLSVITSYVDGFGLKANGEIIAVLASEEDVDKLLAEYQNQLTKPSENNQILSVEYEEEVAKEKVKASLADVKTVEDALQMLLEGKITTVEYTVQQDDSLWTIARKSDMGTKMILDANPDITEESILQPGQVLKLSTAERYLTLISKGQKTVKETIPFDVQTKTDYSLASGKSVVRQAGQDGEKEVSYSYTEKNGELLEKKVIKEEVISQPVKQVIAQGPSRAAVMVSTSRGSGSISGISWPLSGRINSYYGYRGGEFHTGIDIDGDVGQPYAAAAGGKVVQSGWSGNYGKMITIDHGNGVVTKYAHSSQLLVSVGDTVSKGQTIGQVGVTGRTSGAHLHFELLVNGTTVNPLNYL